MSCPLYGDYLVVQPPPFALSSAIPISRCLSKMRYYQAGFSSVVKETPCVWQYSPIFMAT